MKKATLGMVMLVSLVLAKAYIAKEQKDNTVLLRGNTDTAFIIKSSSIRADLYNGGSGQVTLLALNMSQPEFKFHVEVERTLVSAEPINAEVSNPMLEEDVIEVEEIEEVLPMDYNMNTGYGLLKSTTEHIVSKKDRVGKEPLDNSSNTISDNISKMFPRQQ